MNEPAADNDRAGQCALNNARWCDAIARAHDRPGEFWPAVWLNRHPAPSFYPNAVTLSAGATAAQLAAIDELAAIRPSFSVKDSFAALDLRPRGLDVLFEATWLWREPDTRREPEAPAPRPSELRWLRIVDGVGLARWEAVWAGLEEGQRVEHTERVFRPPLLAEPGVVLLAGARHGHVLAVAALNYTERVVGVSNVFAPPEDAADCWAGVVAVAGRLFPGRPLVGYERGDDLASALDVGFQAVGPLRVWAR